ncbi:sensor histidine kinase [Kineococcus rhizosphaerae]|uniref:sensor histidine kinase n=1 Tax=Kineococcus rhizosphaerae TaxID=559628 RepID=UPI0011B1D015|nr:HAMP domain-containing sensor histidine kinase [Kineococcus rhizosphaerae]
MTGGWWRAAGVRVRSTVAATALLAVLVAAGAAVGLAVLRHALVSASVESASVQARLVRVAVTAPALGGEQVPALRAAVGADVERGSHVQVLGADGQVVVASAELAGQPALSGARPDVGVLADEVVDLPQLGRSAPWVVTVAGAEVEGQRFWVVAAEDTTDAQRVLRVALAVLAVTGPGLLAVVAGLTWTFVGRSLRPVEAIRSTVQGITSGGLDGRVPVPAGDDEVSRLAVTMNSMLARLQAAQDAQRRFVADASHELRSPVATLRAAAHVWSRPHPGGPGTVGSVEAAASPDAEFVELVGAESARLQSLVDDLLWLARADEGRAGPAVEVDVDEVVEAEASRLRSLGGVRVVLTAVPVRVVGDAAALARAVRNVVDNARRYAASTVWLELAQEGREGQAGSAEAVVRVGDDGPGVPTPDRERVLGRFVRVEEGRARSERAGRGDGGVDGGGAGLGLAIVAEVLAAHGGSVLVGERAGGGALVELRWPLRPAQPPSAASR